MVERFLALLAKMLWLLAEIKRDRRHIVVSGFDPGPKTLNYKPRIMLWLLAEIKRDRRHIVVSGLDPGPKTLKP